MLANIRNLISFLLMSAVRLVRLDQFVFRFVKMLYGQIIVTPKFVPFGGFGGLLCCVNLLNRLLNCAIRFFKNSVGSSCKYKRPLL